MLSTNRKPVAMRTQLLALPITFLLNCACAQTYVSGGIFTNTTWNQAGSPYVVTDDLVLFDDLILTIEAGVVVQVYPGKRIELRNSRLIAIGSDAEPILFTCSNTSSTWMGLVPIGLVTIYSGNQIHMDHCIVERAEIGVDFDDAYHTPYEFSHCEFRYCESGARDADISFHYGYYLWEDCDFHDNQTGIDGGLHTVLNCRFNNNQTGARCHYLQDCLITGNTEIGAVSAVMTGCTLTGNNIGYDGGIWADWALDDNIVVGNSIGFRMAAFFTSDGSFSGNVICRNTLFNIQRVAWGGNNAANIPGTCFCTDDPAEIAASIYDAVDDVSVGWINFSPPSTDPACLAFHVGVQPLEVPSLSVRPNPARDMLRIDGGCADACVLVGQSGQVFNVNLVPIEGGILLDLGALPSGLYVVKVFMNDQWLRAKVVKE